MAGDRPRYELHFHGLVQAAVVGDDNAVRKTFQDSLVRPLALPVHQLPPALADFTGRQEAIESLTTQLRQTGETAKGFAIVTGMAGVGKSTLAIQVAHQLKQDFPDAQLYVNLRGTESKPLEPFEVVTSFLRGLGVDDQAMPEDLKDRSALYRSHLSSKRAFILLDNARDEAQTLANMGILSMQQSDRNKAIVLWQEALAKLPSDLPKAKRVAEWLHSVKGLEAPQPISTERLQNLDNPPAQPFIFVVLGGLSLVIAIALFFVFLM